MARINLNDWMRQEQGRHFCSCGCGKAITIQRHHHARGIPAYINGHCSRIHNSMAGRSGALNPHYIAGRYKKQDGYFVVLNPERSIDGRKYVLEHRLIMERHLGRKLTPDEHVHHKNGHKTDNRIENLEVLSSGEHSSRHQQELRASIGDERYLLAKRRIYRRESYKELLCCPAS